MENLVTVRMRILGSRLRGMVGKNQDQELVRLEGNADPTSPIRYSNTTAIIADWTCKHRIAFNGSESNSFENGKWLAKVDI